MTYRQKCLPLYKEEEDNRELQRRESGLAPPTPSQIQFFETFSDIPNNAPFDDAKHDVELLATKINASRFIYANAKKFGAKWLIKHYHKIINTDDWADWVSPPPCTAAPPPEKSFARHNYAPCELNRVFANLDDVSFS